jgi:tetratricopeptide (TPR) repeat protein
MNLAARALPLLFLLATGCAGGKPKVVPNTPETQARRLYTEARDLFERADYDGSRAKLELALKQDPKLAPAHTLLGRSAHEEGIFDEALSHFEAALALDPTDAQAWLGQGMTLLSKGDLPAAEKSLLRARELAPEQAPVQFYLGELYSRGARPDLAREFYEAARKLDPGYVWPTLSLARLLRASDPAEAERLANEAAEAKPSLDEPYSVLGLLAADKKDYPKAEEALRKAVEKNPTARNQMNLATILSWQGKLDEAIKLLEAAVSADPSYALAQNNLGHSLRQAGKNAEAISALEKAVALSPNTPLYRINLADTLSANGRSADAAAQYKEALVLAPDLASTARKLALALAASGDPGGAYDALQSFLRGHAEDPSAPALREELSRLAKEELKLQLR